MAETIVARVGEPIAQYPQALGHVAGVADSVINGGVQVAIAGDTSLPIHRQLMASIASVFVPSLVLAGGDANGQPALMRNREAPDGTAVAFVCRGFTCDLPTSDPGQLERQVKQLVGDGSQAGAV
jgi:uncharacterized protein YyaL (SSP411 family)